MIILLLSYPTDLSDIFVDLSPCYLYKVCKFFVSCFTLEIMAQYYFLIIVVIHSEKWSISLMREQGMIGTNHLLSFLTGLLNPMIEFWDWYRHVVFFECYSGKVSANISIVRRGSVDMIWLHKLQMDIQCVSYFNSCYFLSKISETKGEILL